MKPEDLEPWQKKFLQDLRKQDWIITEPLEEPEESEEDKVKEEIEATSDCERLIAWPKKDNPFQNVSAEVLQSKQLDKQIIFIYKYKNLRRKGRLVGREGGIFKIKTGKYKSMSPKDLEKKYPIEAEE